MVETLDEFYTLMIRSRDVRRQIVECVLKGVPVSVEAGWPLDRLPLQPHRELSVHLQIRSHFGISLSNAKESLITAVQPAGSHMLQLRPGNDMEVKLDQLARFDIKTELDEFEKDLNFLKFIQSDDVYNVCSSTIS